MKFYFHTLNEALESEGLLHTWDPLNRPIAYGETRRFTFQEAGSRFGKLISIYRDKNGLYERPTSYNCE